MLDLVANYENEIERVLSFLIPENLVEYIWPSSNQIQSRLLVTETDENLKEVAA